MCAHWSWMSLSKATQLEDEQSRNVFCTCSQVVFDLGNWDQLGLWLAAYVVGPDQPGSHAVLEALRRGILV